MTRQKIVSNRPNNTKKFAIISGSVSGIIIVLWILIWAFSGSSSTKENIEQEKSIVSESYEVSSVDEGSGQWDEEKWGWRNYDKRYGQRGDNLRDR